jgi:hypothetical protein
MVSSCLSMDAVSSDLLGDRAMSFSLTRGEDVGSSSSGGSSPLGWPLGKRERHSTDPSPSSCNLTNGRDTHTWEHKMEIRETDLAEVEMMKEKFAKLLLGEDMSGGAKGVCTAMAISNAITNLSGTCIFGCGSNSILPWSYCGLITAPWIVVYKTLLYPFFICTPF